MFERRLLWSLPLVAVLAVGFAADAGAQRPVSLWVGAGRQVMADSSRGSPRSLDAYGALQLDVPLLPFALRGDLAVVGTDIRTGRRNAIVSAVFPLRLPIVQPYAMVGYGVYDWGRAGEDRGVSLGAGVRLQLGGVGLFGQVRRHQALDRNIATLGLVF